MTLPKGFTGIVKVIEIKENFDQFMNRKLDEPKVNYCHWARFSVEGEDYGGQYCSDSEIIPFGTGDEMKINITGYNEERNIYYFNILEIHPAAVSAITKSQASNSAFAKPLPVSFANGTVNDLALRYAVQFNGNRVDADAGKVLKDARIFKSFLLEQ